MCFWSYFGNETLKVLSKMSKRCYVGNEQSNSGKGKHKIGITCNLCNYQFHMRCQRVNLTLPLSNRCFVLLCQMLQMSGDRKRLLNKVKLSTIFWFTKMQDKKRFQIFLIKHTFLFQEIHFLYSSERGT